VRIRPPWYTRHTNSSAPFAQESEHGNLGVSMSRRLSGDPLTSDVAFSISTDEFDDDNELRVFGNRFSANLPAWIV